MADTLGGGGGGEGGGGRLAEQARFSFVSFHFKFCRKGSPA